MITGAHMGAPLRTDPWRLRAFRYAFGYGATEPVADYASTGSATGCIEAPTKLLIANCPFPQDRPHRNDNNS